MIDSAVRPRIDSSRRAATNQWDRLDVSTTDRKLTSRYEQPENRFVDSPRHKARLLRSAEYGRSRRGTSMEVVIDLFLGLFSSSFACSISFSCVCLYLALIWHRVSLICVYFCIDVLELAWIPIECSLLLHGFTSMLI